MASIEQVISSFTPLTRSANEWHGACPQCDGALAVIGDRWRCASCGAHDAGDDAAAFLMIAEGCDRATAEAQLTNGRTWDAVLIKPAPKPPRWGLHRVADDPRVVLIVDTREAAKAADEKLTGYLTVLWPGGGSRWDGLEPLRGRSVLLWPSIEGLQGMERLEAVLTDPAGLACTGSFIVPSDLAPWDADTDTIIKWAKERKRSLTYQQQQVSSYPSLGLADQPEQSGNAEPEAPLPPALASPADAGIGIESDRYRPNGPSPVIAVTDGIGPLEVDLSDAEPPPTIESDWPPNAAKSPRKRRSGHLRAVDSGNLALSPDAEAEPMPAELSEDQLADDFAVQHGEDWRCVKVWGQWLHWDGDGWIEDRDDSRVEPMRKLYRQALYSPEGQRLTPDGRRKLGRQATAYASLRYAGTDPRIRATPEIWDTDPYMLGVPGGVIDLRAGKLIDAAREQCITMRASVAPALGSCPTWLEMLRYWQGGDDDVIGFLRRYLGYALTGDNREQCMAFFYGPASSGKGTIMRLISYLLGSAPPPLTSKYRSYHYEAPISTFLESRNERHSTELAAMHQKRLITSEEPAAGAKWDEAKIKWLTGGSFVTARYMRGDNFSFAMTGKIIVAANHRPRLATTDASIKRRMHVIPFDHPVADEDRDNNLDARLRAEAPQILHWLIEACLEWQDAGLGLPERIAASTETYLQAEDVLAQWIDEACERDTDCDSKTLYQCYCRWAEEQGEKVWSRRAWANALVERGFKTRKGTAGMRMFCGLSPRLGPAPQA